MKNNRGITLVALVITIIIMTIIASIAIHEGKDLITKSKIETQIANMSIIKANAKKYAEEIESKIWQEGSDKENKRSVEFSKRGLTQSVSNQNEYTITNEGFEKMGLEDLKNQQYTIIYSNNFNTIDVRYEIGIKYKGNSYNLLSELQNLTESDTY